MIGGWNFFDQPVKSSVRNYENIRKIANGEGDDYTTACLLDYSCFRENYKFIAIDLCKQKALVADLKAMYQVNFFGNHVKQEI